MAAVDADGLDDGLTDFGGERRTSSSIDSCRRSAGFLIVSSKLIDQQPSSPFGPR